MRVINDFKMGFQAENLGQLTKTGSISPGTVSTENDRSGPDNSTDAINAHHKNPIFKRIGIRYHKFVPVFYGWVSTFHQGQIADAMIRAGFKSVQSRTLSIPLHDMDLDIARKER